MIWTLGRYRHCANPIERCMGETASRTFKMASTQALILLRTLLRMSEPEFLTPPKMSFMNTAKDVGNTVESPVETVGNQAINTVENAAGQIQQDSQTVAGVLQGNVDITKGIGLPLNVGQSGVRTNLFTDET